MPRKITQVIALFLCLCLLFEQTGLAQVLPALATPLPTPPLLRYLSVNSSNPFNYFNFLLDKGTATEGSPERSRGIPDLTKEAKKLIHYFFLGLTLPDKAFWVNLRPDEPGRITSDELSQTDLGKVLLEQDLRLKKGVSQLLHPHHPQGKVFWTKLYDSIGKDKAKQAQITTSNRVWIVPDKAVVLETEDGALVVEARLKVLLENEYLQAKSIEHRAKDQDKIQTLSESLMKQIILPALTEEVNTSPNYAPLRQIYHSLILAQWFKRKHRQGLSPQGTVPDNPYAFCIDKGYLKGLESELPWSKQALWQEYLESYSKGEYKLKDRLAGLNRMYFSGGVYLACDGSNGSSPITVIKGGAGAAGSLLSLIEDDKLIQQLPNMVPVVEETSAVIPKKGEFPTGKSTVIELPEREPTKQEASLPIDLSAEQSQPEKTGASSEDTPSEVEKEKKRLSGLSSVFKENRFKKILNFIIMFTMLLFPQDIFPQVRKQNTTINSEVIESSIKGFMNYIVKNPWLFFPTYPIKSIEDIEKLNLEFRGSINTLISIIDGNNDYPVEWRISALERWGFYKVKNLGIGADYEVYSYVGMLLKAIENSFNNYGNDKKYTDFLKKSLHDELEFWSDDVISAARFIVTIAENRNKKYSSDLQKEALKILVLNANEIAHKLREDHNKGVNISKIERELFERTQGNLFLIYGVFSNNEMFTDLAKVIFDYLEAEARKSQKSLFDFLKERVDPQRIILDSFIMNAAHFKLLNRFFASELLVEEVLGYLFRDLGTDMLKTKSSRVTLFVQNVLALGSNFRYQNKFQNTLLGLAQDKSLTSFQRYFIACLLALYEKNLSYLSSEESKKMIHMLIQDYKVPLDILYPKNINYSEIFKTTDILTAKVIFTDRPAVKYFDFLTNLFTGKNKNRRFKDIRGYTLYSNNGKTTLLTKGNIKIILIKNDDGRYDIDNDLSDSNIQIIMSYSHTPNVQSVFKAQSKPRITNKILFVSACRSASFISGLKNYYKASRVIGVDALAYGSRSTVVLYHMLEKLGKREVNEWPQLKQDISSRYPLAEDYVFPGEGSEVISEALDFFEATNPASSAVISSARNKQLVSSPIETNPVSSAVEKKSVFEIATVSTPKGLLTNQLKQYITDHRQNPFEVLITAVRENQVVTLGENHDDARMIKFAAGVLPLLVRQGLTHLAFEGKIQYQNALEVFIAAWKDSGENDFNKFIEKEIWVKIVDAGGWKRLEFSPLLNKLPKSSLKEADILYGRKPIPPSIELLRDIIPSSYDTPEYIREKFRFFKAAYNEGLKVKFIDSRTIYGQEGNKDMAEAIASMIIDNPSAKILFYGGNSHAQKNEYPANASYNANRFIPAEPISQYLKQLLPDIKVYTVVQNAPLGERKSSLSLPGLEELEKESFALLELEETPLRDLPFSYYTESYHWLEAHPSNRLGSVADAVIFHGVNPTVNVGSPMIMPAFEGQSPAGTVPAKEGGIDLSDIELALKDKKSVSSLNPAERQILLAEKYFKDGWESLSLLYIHQIMLMLKDNLIKDIQNREILFGILKQLQLKDFLDPQGLQFLNFLHSQKPLSEIKVVMMN